MQPWGNCLLFHALDIWFTCSFRILTALQVVRGTVLRSAREYACVCCVIELQRQCWPGIGEAVGSWERPLCLLVHSCTETSHCEVWPVLGEVIVLHFSHLLFLLSCTVMHQRGGKKVAFHWWTCTGTHWGGVPVSWLQLPFMSPSHSPATCMNPTKWLITLTSSLKDRSECTAGMAALLWCCNFVQTWVVREWQWDLLWEWVKYWLSTCNIQENTPQVKRCGACMCSYVVGMVQNAHSVTVASACFLPRDCGRAW